MELLMVLPIKEMECGNMSGKRMICRKISSNIDMNINIL